MINVSLALCILNTHQHEKNMSYYGNETRVILSIDPEYNIFISVLLSVASICGGVQTLIIIYVFFKNSAIRTPTNLLVLSFTILDLCLLVFGTPMVIVSSAFQRWVFGQAGCIYYGFITGFLGLSILTIMAVISVDRYVVIVKTHLKHYITKNVVVKVTAGSMTYGLFWSLCPVIGWNTYRLEGVQTSCAVNWRSKDPYDVAYIITLFTFCWFIPLIVMTFCYTSIYMKIRRDTSRNRLQGKVSTVRRLETEVAKTTFAMICSYVVSWGPYSVVSLWWAFGDTTNFPSVLAVIPTVACKLSVVWNPAIYIYKNRHIRGAILERFPWLSSCFGASHRINVSFVPEQRNAMELMPTSLTQRGTTDSITTDDFNTIRTTTPMQYEIHVADGTTISSISPLPNLPNIASSST